MSDFDIAIGMNEKGLNDASSSLYKKLGDKVFSGTDTIDYNGISVDTTWVIQSAPVFHLSSEMATNNLVSFISQSIRDDNGKKLDLSIKSAYVNKEAGFLVDAANVFGVEISKVKIDLSSNHEIPTSVTISANASCTLAMTSGGLSIIVNTITIGSQQDDLTKFMIDRIVIPQLKNMLNKVFSGLKVSSIDMGDIKLSPMTINLQGNFLVATLNLASKGAPAPITRELPWPDKNFFCIIGEEIVQQQVAKVISSSHFSHNGSDGPDGFNAWYNFSLELVNPSIHLQQGENISVNCELGGSVGAGVNVFWAPIGLSYRAYCKPNPTAALSISTSGGDLKFKTETVSPFIVVVEPNGDIPSQILSWMTEFIVQGVVGALSPMISSFLGGLEIGSYKVPTITQTIDGIQTNFTPTNLSVSGWNGMIGLTGDLAIT